MVCPLFENRVKDQVGKLRLEFQKVGKLRTYHMNHMSECKMCMLLMIYVDVYQFLCKHVVGLDKTT